MYDYKSPITVLQTQIEAQLEGEILKTVHKVGVLVDKEELVKALKNDREQYEKGYDDGFDDGFNTSKWIPCSERLPNYNGVYQITRKLAEGEYNFYISDSAYFDGQNTWHSDNRVNHGRPYLKDVIAWQPLPEPYKEGES